MKRLAISAFLCLAPVCRGEIIFYVRDGIWHWTIRWDSRQISTFVGGEGSRRVWKVPYEKPRKTDKPDPDSGGRSR